MRSSNKPVSARASVEQLEARRLLSAAAHLAASSALTAHHASATVVANFHKGNHPKGRRLGTAAAVSASASPALDTVTTAVAAPGLIDAVYHGNRAYTSAGATVPANSPNTGLTDAAFGGDDAGATRTIAWAATHQPNYTFTNTANQFIYGNDSSTKTATFLGNDASGAAAVLADPANVNDTIFDAQGYFLTPSANDAGIYNVLIGGVDDFFAVFMGGDGTPGSGTLVASNGWQGGSAGLPGYNIDLEHMGADTTQPTSIPIEIIYGNGFGGAGSNIIGGTQPQTSIQIIDSGGNQVTQFRTDATNEPAPDPFSTPLTAPLAANQTVQLSWGQAFDANSYSVFRYVTSAGAGSAVAIATGLKTTNYPVALGYTDTTVSNDVTYSYYIVATNAGGTSQSNTITVTPRASAPGAPTGVIAGVTNVPGTGVQGHVAFNTVTFGTSYIVQRAPESSPGSGTPGAFATVTGGGSLTGSGQIFFTDTDPTLKPTATYFYQVIAVGSTGLQSTPGGPVKVAPAGNALAAEGTVEVDVRAINSPAGTTNSILNLGNQQGVFNAVGGAVNVAAVTDGSAKTVQSFNFGGANSASSSFNSPTDLTGNSSRSVELWVDNPTIDNIEETMVSWGHRGGPDGTNMGFSYGSTYGVGLWGGGFDLTYTANNVAGQPAAPPTANTWHYLVYTWDGTNNKVYVDGTLYLQRATAPLTTFAGFPVSLGAQNSSATAGTFTAAINGSVDLASVRISGGALTQADINNNFKAGVPGQSAVPTLPAYITATPGAVFGYDATAHTLNLLNTGTLTFTDDEANNVPSYGAPLAVSATGANASLVLQTNQHLAGLSLTDSTATLPAATATTLNLSGALTLTGNGTLDMGKGSMLLPSSPTIAQYVTRAAGAPLPSSLNAWTGPGLTSSLVKADAANGNAKQLALGYWDSQDNGNTGLSVPAGMTLVHYTVYGDATGDGKVTIADLSVWNNNFGTSSPRWSQGDFNYDGKVNIADLSVWNNDFGNKAPA